MKVSKTIFGDESIHLLSPHFHTEVVTTLNFTVSENSKFPIGIFVHLASNEKICRTRDCGQFVILLTEESIDILKHY
jgi:hypothetical protein